MSQSTFKMYNPSKLTLMLHVQFHIGLSGGARMYSLFHTPFTSSHSLYLASVPKVPIFLSMMTQSTKSPLIYLFFLLILPVIPRVTNLSYPWRCFLSSVSPLCPSFYNPLALVYTISTSNRVLIDFLISTLPPAHRFFCMS